MGGEKFGVGFAVLILIHEMGHYIDIRRLGLPPSKKILITALTIDDRNRINLDQIVGR
jgi:hypothetical protein